MTVNAIQVTNLTKRYPGFLLDNVSFSVPSGYVCGFIGQNGSGKTTTLKLMLQMAYKDSGEITILGQPESEISIKEQLGVLFDSPPFDEIWTANDIERVLKPFYPQWNKAAFKNYLQRFHLDPNQRFGTLSRGMKMKLGLAVSLSHEARLLLLDEPTSGLDPVIRSEVLGILQEYLSDEDKTVFFSTHITGDLEKIADYIVYIHEGRILFCGQKNQLVEQYCIVRGSSKDIDSVRSRQVIGLREHLGGFEGLLDIGQIGGLAPGVVTEAASLDDIMVHIGRGGA